jgi:hypothetical protein
MSSINWVQRGLLDSALTFGSTRLDAYLRVQNFSETKANGEPELFVEVGISMPTTGSDGGTTDIKIVPPPAARDLGIKGAGIEGSEIYTGTVVFLISHTWVMSQMSLLGLTSGQEEQVFGNRNGLRAVGIFYNNRLFTIDKVEREPGPGGILQWHITGSALEQGVG